MNVSTPNCPVPPDQLPLNEYQTLKESWFFQWSTLVTIRYLQRLLTVGFVAWLFCLPFAREAFLTQESWTKWAIAAAAIFFTLIVRVNTMI